MIRRTFQTFALLALLPLGLAGCGFHPVYAPHHGQGHSQTDTTLAAINIERIPDRQGQLMREALEQRLQGTGEINVPKRYDLQVILVIGSEGMGILMDNSTSRLRYTGIANFILRDRSANRSIVTSGSVRRLDAANVIDNQYFASNLEAETITNRMTSGLADMITLKLAAYFHDHPPSTASTADKKPDPSASSSAPSSGTAPAHTHP